MLGVQMGRHSSGAEFPRPRSQLAGLGGGSASAFRKGLSVRFPLWMPGLLFTSGRCPAQQPGSHRASSRQGGDGRRWVRTCEGARAPSCAAQGRERHRPGRRLGPPAAISNASGQASSANERTGERVRAAGRSKAGGPAPTPGTRHGTPPAGPLPLCSRRWGAQPMPCQGGAGTGGAGTIGTQSPGSHHDSRDPKGCWGWQQTGTELVHSRAFTKAWLGRGQLTKDRPDPRPGSSLLQDRQ